MASRGSEVNFLGLKQWLIPCGTAVAELSYLYQLRRNNGNLVDGNKLAALCTVYARLIKCTKFPDNTVWQTRTVNGELVEQRDPFVDLAHTVLSCSSVWRMEATADFTGDEKHVLAARERASWKYIGLINHCIDNVQSLHRQLLEELTLVRRCSSILHALVSVSDVEGQRVLSHESLPVVRKVVGVLLSEADTRSVVDNTAPITDAGADIPVPMTFDTHVCTQAILWATRYFDANAAYLGEAVASARVLFRTGYVIPPSDPFPDWYTKMEERVSRRASTSTLRIPDKILPILRREFPRQQRSQEELFWQGTGLSPVGPRIRLGIEDDDGPWFALPDE